MPAASDVKLSILDAQNRTVCTSTAPGAAGINRVQWTLVTPQLNTNGGGGRGGNAQAPVDNSCSGGANRGGGTPLAAGIYTAKLTENGKDNTKPVPVLEDIWLPDR